MDVSGIRIQDKIDIADSRELNAVFMISSAKPGNGVEQLRDNNLETYWQSDGAAPHIINIQFPKKVSITHVCLYIDFNLDESYTAKKISIRSGTNLHDLIDITTFELTEPSGWIIATLSASTPNAITSFTDTTASLSNETQGTAAAPLRTHFLQVRIHTMHQNGRDTHIRQVKILGPRTSPLVMGGGHTLADFKTVDMLQYAVLR